MALAEAVRKSLGTEGGPREIEAKLAAASPDRCNAVRVTSLSATGATKRKEPGRPTRRTNPAPQTGATTGSSRTSHCQSRFAHHVGIMPCIGDRDSEAESRLRLE